MATRVYANQKPDSEGWILIQETLEAEVIDVSIFGSDRLQSVAGLTRRTRIRERTLADGYVETSEEISPDGGATWETVDITYTRNQQPVAKPPADRFCKHPTEVVSPCPCGAECYCQTVGGCRNARRYAVPRTTSGTVCLHRNDPLPLGARCPCLDCYCQREGCTQQRNRRASAMFCQHANEVPQRCPCSAECYCRVEGSCRLAPKDPPQPREKSREKARPAPEFRPRPTGRDVSL